MPAAHLHRVWRAALAASGDREVAEEVTTAVLCAAPRGAAGCDLVRDAVLAAARPRRRSRRCPRPSVRPSPEDLALARAEHGERVGGLSALAPELGQHPPRQPRRDPRLAAAGLEHGLDELVGRHVGMALAQRGARLEARQLGHVEVEQDDVGGAALGQGQRLAPVAGPGRRPRPARPRAAARRSPRA
jgi:hypothetical protein